MHTLLTARKCSNIDQCDSYINLNHSWLCMPSKPSILYIMLAKKHGSKLGPSCLLARINTFWPVLYTKSIWQVSVPKKKKNSLGFVCNHSEHYLWDFVSSLTLSLLLKNTQCSTFWGHISLTSIMLQLKMSAPESRKWKIVALGQ